MFEVGLQPDKILFCLGISRILGIKCSSVAKDDFKAMSLNDFWAKYVYLYRNIGDIAMRILLPYLAIYMCESGFSALVSGKTKARNKLDYEAYARCALSSTKPRTVLVVSKKQLHPSH